MEKTTNELAMEVKNLRVALSDLHLKHKSLANEVQSHRDTYAKNKAQLKHLAGSIFDVCGKIYLFNNFNESTLNYSVYLWP